MRLALLALLRLLLLLHLQPRRLLAIIIAFFVCHSFVYEYSNLNPKQFHHPPPSNTASPTPNPSVTSSATPTPSVSPVTPTPAGTPTPSVSPGTTATFDFDSGTPTLNVRQPEPFDQTSNGVTAHFSSPFDFPSAFSVQNIQSLASISTVINSTKFSGLFLWPSTPNRDPLIINFSRNIANITLTFKTAELQDPGPGSTGSRIRLSAYLNSASTPVGSTTVRGQETLFDTYPEGTLSFNMSGQQFNSIKIDLPFSTDGASGFIIDNIVIVTA